MFGQPLPPATDNPLPVTPLNMHPMAQAVAAKPKLNWLGVLADALSGAAGQTPLYTHSLMLQRQMQLQQQMLQGNSDRELERGKALYDYEQAHKAPEQGETERLISLAATLPDSDPRKKLIMDKLNTDPVVTLTLPGNHVYSGPRSGLAAALGGAAQSPDDAPATEDGYSYTPGPGGRANKANWKAIGGQSGARSTGGF